MNNENNAQNPTPVVPETNGNNPEVASNVNPETTSTTPNTEQPAPAAPQTPAPATTQAAPAEPKPVVRSGPKIEDKVIYKIKPDKGPSVFGIIFFFVLIFAALYYLPQISDELSKYIPGISPVSGPTPRTNVTPEEEPKEEEPKPEEKKDELLDLNGFISNAEIDNLKLGNFVKDNNSGENRLRFYILNNSEEAFLFSDNTKFYLDFYSDNQYLSSALVYSFKDIAPKESVDFSVPISGDAYKRANKFKIVRKNKSDIKAVNLKQTEGDYKILTCTYGNNSINYYFLDNYLEIIDDYYKESSTNPNYYADLERYRSEASKYASYPSIDYNVIEAMNEFTIKTRIELEKIKDSDLKKLETYKFFSYHKESKVVSFDMISLGYHCS